MTSPFPGMDLSSPATDWPALAAAVGMPALRVGSAGELRDTLSGRRADQGPLLVEVPILGFADGPA